ncbi:hypothetical protein L195_g035708, partial [Trifolium pratense]
VLNENVGVPNKELEAAKVKIAKLDAANRELGNQVVDLKGKTENFAALQGDVNRLNLQVTELEGQKKELKEGLEKLRKDMAPSAEEAEGTRHLSSRAELVAAYSELLGQLTDLAKQSFQNAVDQLQIVNPELVVEGIGFWREVKDGVIVLDEDNKANEVADLEAAEKAMDVEIVDDTEEQQGESG